MSYSHRSLFSKSLQREPKDIQHVEPRRGASTSTKDSQALSVSQCVRQVARLLHQEIPRLQIRGEISNLRRAQSGHIYFTLKDRDAELACVLFRDVANRLRAKLEGEVIIDARLTLYKRSGRFQAQVLGLAHKGEGELRVELRERYERLRNEGLFNDTRKKELPRLTRDLALVTSRQGDALRDIQKVILSSQLPIRLHVFHASVQGQKSVDELLHALSTIEEQIHRFDAVIISRGGGAFEDLLSFSDERLIRYIAQMNLCTVAGVGHERDRMLIDEVTDIRAATPTHAAEIVCQHLKGTLEEWALLQERLHDQLRYRLDHAAHRLGLTASSIVSPKLVLERALHRISTLESTLERSIVDISKNAKELRTEFEMILERFSPRTLLGQKKALLNAHEYALKESLPDIDRLRVGLKSSLKQLQMAQTSSLKSKFSDLSRATEVLDSLSPLKTLGRGYCLARNERRNATLRSMRDFKVGDEYSLLVHDGRIQSKVLHIDLNKENKQES